MKKEVKILTILMLILTIVFSLSNIVLAETAAPGVNVDTVFSQLQNKVDAQNTDGITEIGGKIIGYIQVIGIVVGVVIVTILGIKYMMGSAQEKAEYKKTMIPYLIGAIFVFAAPTIVKLVIDIANGIKTDPSATQPTSMLINTLIKLA